VTTTESSFSCAWLADLQIDWYFMPDELESKIRVAEHEPVRGRLREANAEYLGRVLETNRLFDDDKWTLLKGGCGLRVRSCRTLDGPEQPATLTYKGPLRDGAFKRKSEIEIEIADAVSMVGILAAMGFSEWIIFEKNRESWRLPPCEVELDEVPGLGLFVEVEGPDEAAIRAALARLGLDPRQSTRRSYVAMLAEGANTCAPRPLEFKFG